MIHLRLMLALLTASILAACNNDIFVNDPTPSATEAVIEGDGGEATITIQPNGLKWIGFDIIEGKYYNHNGDMISPENPADQVAHISYESPDIVLDVYLNGNKLTVKCSEHSTMSDWNTSLRLDYEYTVVFISLKVLAGTKSSVVAIEYSDDINITEDVRQTGLTYHNNSPVTQTVEIQPYIAAQACALIKPEALWAEYANVDIPVPTYTDSRWELGKSREMRLATTLYYCPASLNRNLNVSVNIPPHATMKCQVTYLTAEMHGNMTFSTPTGRMFNTAFKCTVTEPVGYEIIINEDEQ